jgi:hypothetical protein
VRQVTLVLQGIFKRVGLKMIPEENHHPYSGLLSRPNVGDLQFTLGVIVT